MPKPQSKTKKQAAKPRKTLSKTVAEHGAKAGEMVDVVDKKDKVLRTVSRVEAMEKGLRFRFIQVLVFNSERELWVQWRSRHKIVCPRQYGASVGGTVEAGEDYETAALRELKEEMGIEGVEIVPVGFYTVDGPQPYNAMTYACQYDGEDFSGWEDEADALDLVNEEEISFMLARFPYLFTEGLAKALEMMMEDEA